MRMNVGPRYVARTRGRRIVQAAVLCALPLLAGTGCIVTSGQVMVSFELADVSIPTVASALRQDIDLNTISEYQDYKQDLKALADLAILGQVHNMGAATSVEFWMTPGLTSHTTAAAVRGDATAVPVWGPFAVAAGATEQIDWDDSAALFVGRAPLLAEAQGDGSFSLYILPSSTATTATFDFNNGVIVLVLDAGI